MSIFHKLQEEMMVLTKYHDERKSIIIWNYYKEAQKNNILRYYLPIWFDSFIFAASIKRIWQP